MAIKVYGTPWCPDCRRSKQFLGEHRIAYDWVDIDEHPDAADEVRQLNQGKQIIPTILFEDGSILAEPTNAELAAKLGLGLKAKRSFYDLILSPQSSSIRDPHEPPGQRVSQVRVGQTCGGIRRGSSQRRG